MRYYDLKKKEYVEKNEKSKRLSFLYNYYTGRLVLKLMFTRCTKPFYRYLNSSKSIRRIDKFIRKNGINMQDYEEKVYTSFNDFFMRKIKTDKRNIEEGLFAIADSKLSVFKINNDSAFNIKESIYTVDELLGCDGSAFKDGYALIFRLSVDDYHHYVFPDDGKVIKKDYIKGKLHTVQPIAFKKFKVFCENTREITYLDTKNYGKIAYIEVGAMLVGKIVNNDLKTFKRGQEKGHFEFGGSTIILLFKKDTINLNPILIENTSKDIETIVKLGDSLE